MARAVEQAGGNALFGEHIRLIADGQGGRAAGHRAGHAAGAHRSPPWRSAPPGASRCHLRATLLGGWGCGGHWAARDCAELAAGLSTLCEAELIQLQPQSTLRGEEEYGFRHAIVQDAAYGLLTDGDRITGHIRAAEFLEHSAAPEASAIADHFERSGEKLRAAQFYCRAAEEGLWRGDIAGSCARSSAGSCAAQMASCGQLHSIEAYMLMLADQHERLAAVADVAIAVLPPGSVAWCRAVGPAVFDAISRQDAARVQTLVAMMLPTEPGARGTSRVCRCADHHLCHLHGLRALPLLQIVLHRLTAIVDQAVAEKSDALSLRPHLPRLACAQSAGGSMDLGSGIPAGHFRLRASGRPAVGDWMRAATIESGWLNLGDIDGAHQRLTAMTAHVEKCQHLNTIHLAAPFGLDAVPVGKGIGLATGRGAGDRDGAAWQRLLPVSQPRSRTARTAGAAARPAARSPGAGRCGDAVFLLAPPWLARVAPVQIKPCSVWGDPLRRSRSPSWYWDSSQRAAGSALPKSSFAYRPAWPPDGRRQPARAHSELQATLRLIQHLVDDIRDPFWRNCYLSRNHSCVRAQQLAIEWGVDRGEQEPAAEGR